MRAPGAARLFRRQLLADRGAALAVVTVVLVVAALLAAWPRVLDRMFTEDVREQIAATPGLVRDLSGLVTVVSPIQAGVGLSADEAYARLEEQLEGIAESAPPLVREIMGEPRYQLLGSGRGFVDGVPKSAVAVNFTVIADPHYAGRIQLVEGKLPVGVTRGEPIDDARFEELLDSSYATVPEPVLHQLARNPKIFDVIVSVRTAERLDWEVGQTRLLEPSDFRFPPVLLVRLTGVFEPADPSAGYWPHSFGLLEPAEEHDPLSGVTVFARGFIAPAAISMWRERAFTAQVWFPMDGSTMQAAEAPDVLSDLRAFTAQPYPVGFSELPDALELHSGSIDRLTQTLVRQASATALISLVAAGPFGVALAVLALGSRLISVRRRRAMALVAARGASRRQLRTLLGVEGALLGLPAAALAVAAVAWIVPGRGGVAGIALPAAVGLAPAVLLPLAVKPGALRAERTDLRRRRRDWLRWALEVLVVGAAAASVMALNRRGLVTGDPGRGVDPLLVAAPLLVTLAVCVVVLRLYPLPVAALGWLLKRRSGVVAFVGAVRGVRDPAAGMAPVVALVAGLSIAVFSTVLWSTAFSGGVSTSVAEVGADLRAAGTIFIENQAEEVEQVTGVSAAVTVTEYGSAEVTVGDRVDQAAVYVTDTAALATVQAGLTGVAPIADGLDETRDGVVPAMVSADLGRRGENGTIDVSGGLDITVADVAPRIAGLTASEPWVLLDRDAFSAAAAGGERPSRLLLIDADPGAEIDQDEITQILGPDARVTSATDVLAEVRGDTVDTGLMVSFVTAAAVVGLLSAAAVLLTMVIGAPSRGRLLSQLRTLGLTGRQARALAVWEMAPPALVALLFGAGLGLGLPWLVFSALDLRPLTGAETQPPVTVDWVLVGGAAGTFVIIVGVAVAMAVASSRRLRLGAVLRVGEEL